MSRGCITVMEEGSYAANGIKHCVRPVDMTGKSAALIMRQMHKDCVKDAKKYNELVEMPILLSSLKIEPEEKTVDTDSKD